MDPTVLHKSLWRGGDELHCLKKSQLALGFVCALLELFSPFICVLLELIVSLRQSGERDDRAQEKDRRAHETADVF